MRMFKFEKWHERERQYWKRYIYWMDVTKWHSWFAWYPVQLGIGTWVWLETLQRKRYISPFCKLSYWEYAEQEEEECL